METMEDERRISLYFLPPEILVRIFSYLSLPDRRSVRLVCHQCYDLCTVFAIKKSEKYVVRTDATLIEFAAFCRKSPQRNVNVEFQKIPDFARVVPDLWRVSGEKLHSLNLFNSQISDSTMECIITSCVNLVELHIQLGVARSEAHQVLFSQKAFDDPIRKEVTRTKLRIFSIVVGEAHIPSWLLRKIFIIYPRIENFGIGSSPNTCSTCTRISSFPRPRRYVQYFDELESLRFNVMSTGGWIKSWINHQPDERQEPRLKRFEAILLYTEPLTEWLLQFFSIQKSLRVVNLRIIDFPVDDRAEENLVKLITNHARSDYRGKFVLYKRINHR